MIGLRLRLRRGLTGRARATAPFDALALVTLSQFTVQGSICHGQPESGLRRVRRAAGEFIPARSASKCVQVPTRWRFALVFGHILICRSPKGALFVVSGFIGAFA
jgi:hypothetical protein